MHGLSRTLSPEFLRQVIPLALPKRINASKTRKIEFPTTVLCLQVANELSLVVCKEVRGSHGRIFVVRSSDRHLRDCAIEVEPYLFFVWLTRLPYPGCNLGCGVLSQASQPPSLPEPPSVWLLMYMLKSITLSPWLP